MDTEFGHLAWAWVYTTEGAITCIEQSAVISEYNV